MRVVRTKVFQQLGLGSSPITALGSCTQALLPFRAHGKGSFLKAGVMSNTVADTGWPLSGPMQWQAQRLTFVICQQARGLVQKYYACTHAEPCRST